MHLLKVFGAFFEGVFYSTLFSLSLALNLVGSVGLFLYNLGITGMGAVLAEGRAFKQSCVDSNASPSQLLVNFLEFLFIFTPLMIINALLNVAVSALSLVADFVVNIGANAVAMICSPFATTADVVVDENRLGSHNMVSIFGSVLKFGAIERDLPLTALVDKHASLNGCSGKSQNRFFEKIRPSDSEKCYPLVDDAVNKLAYK